MKKNYTLKLEGKEWTNALDKAFEKKKKDLKVDGFRKGQVPKEIYIKKFGYESLYMDAIDTAVDVLYAKLMNDKDTIIPVATPTIDVKSVNEKECEIEFTLVSMPEVKLGKYNKLNIAKKDVNVTDEEIDHELEHLKEHFVDVKTLDENAEIKEGNIAVIDFEGFLNNKAFDGGKGTDYSLTIGSHTFIPGFEEGLVGLKKGDKKDLEVKFPENYASNELKGKDVIFKVEVKEVKERVMPEFNDAFFKDLGIKEVNSLEELRSYIEKNIKNEKEKTNNDEYLFACLDKVVKDAKFEIPEEMTNDEVDRLTSEFDERLKYQGLNLKDYLKFSNTDLKDFKDSLKGEANKRISYRLVMNAVIDKEKLEVTEEEVNKDIEDKAKEYGISKEEYIKEIGNTENIKYDLLMKKAMDVVTK